MAQAVDPLPTKSSWSAFSERSELHFRYSLIIWRDSATNSLDCRPVFEASVCVLPYVGSTSLRT